MSYHTRFSLKISPLWYVHFLRAVCSFPILLVHNPIGNSWPGHNETGGVIDRLTLFGPTYSNSPTSSAPSIMVSFTPTVCPLLTSLFSPHCGGHIFFHPLGWIKAQDRQMSASAPALGLLFGRQPCRTRAVKLPVLKNDQCLLLNHDPFSRSPPVTHANLSIVEAKRTEIQSREKT